MRPLELVVEGFRSFASRTVFDWRGRRLVGVVGPIGSGKSSILDAIVFALYGKTPVFESGTKALIKQDCDAARVELAFEVEGRSWRALRVIRRRGASQHALYREPPQLRSAGGSSRDSGPRVPEHEKEREVNARVEELLGLDFQAFCRSVLLAQNRFAEFLNATPGVRDKVLKGVFGFDRIDAMQAVARQRRGAAELEVRELEGRLGAVEEERERLAELRRAAARSARSAERLAAAAERIAVLEQAVVSAADQRRQAGKTLEELAALTEQLPARVRIEAILGETAAASSATAAAERAWKSARSAVAEAEEASRVTSQEVGSPEHLARAESLIESSSSASERLEEARQNHRGIEAWVSTTSAELAQAIAKRQRAEQAAQDAERAAQRAASDVERAEVRLHSLQHREMAHSLRQTLELGEPCPVCERRVEKLPEGAPSPAVGEARSRLEACRAARQEADSIRRQSSSRVATLREAVLGAERAKGEAAAQRLDSARRLERAVAACKDLSAELAELVGAAGEGDPMAFIEGSRSRLAAASAQLETAREREREAAVEAEKARRGIEQAQQDRLALASRLAALAGRVGWVAAARGEPPDPADLLAQIDARLSAGRAAAEGDRRDAADRARAASKEQAAIREDLGLALDASFEERLAAARSDRDRDGARLAELESRLQRAAAIEQRLARASARQRLYQQLSDDLSAPHFLRYLLDEERNALAELGSRLFEMLSGGRYRFTSGAAFSIVDLANAEAVRKAGTLSGGETFLASLALALALAEKVIGSGGRLDAFFLDEGFGSLDQEHLDLALDGIERLVRDSPNRLVVVVSHVAELRDRVEDLIELDKDPSGNTVVRRGASLQSSG